MKYKIKFPNGKEIQCLDSTEWKDISRSLEKDFGMNSKNELVSILFEDCKSICKRENLDFDFEFFKPQIISIVSEVYKKIDHA